jgi:mono/diheme cytochrome c family protein
MPRVPPRLIIVPTIAAAAFAALGGSSLLGQQPGAASSSAQIQNPVAATPKSIDSGRQLYQRYCRPCHGEEARGDGPQAPKDIHPPNLADAEWKYGSTDGEIFRNIRDGIGPAFDMKPMKSRLTADETWNIVNYLRSLSAR